MEQNGELRKELVDSRRHRHLRGLEIIEWQVVLKRYRMRSACAPSPLALQTPQQNITAVWQAHHLARQPPRLALVHSAEVSD